MKKRYHDRFKLKPVIKITQFKSPSISPRQRIKCPCGCGGKVDVFCDNVLDTADDGFVDIGGVLMTRDDWIDVICGRYINVTDPKKKANKK